MSRQERDPETPVVGLSEEEMKARHRSALSAGDQQLATDTAYLMATRWMGQGREDEVEELCWETLGHFEDARLLHLLARTEAEHDHREAALEYYERALACSLPPTPTSAISIVIERSGLLHNFALFLVTAEDVRESIEPSPEVDRAIELWREALTSLEGFDDEAAQRWILIQNACGMVAFKCGMDRADMLWDRLATLLIETDDAQNATRVLHHRGVKHYQDGELERAAKYLRKALDLARETGDEEGQRAATLNLDTIMTRLKGQLPS